MQEMETQLEDQNERLTSQERSINEYKERVRELERTVKELETKQESDVSENSGELQDGANKDPSISTKGQARDSGDTKEVTRQRRLVMNDGEPVVFHAIIKASAEVGHLGINQKIIFPDVMTNLGGGYHSHTGVFIAPRTGIYLFSTTITSYKSNHVSILADIVNNGNHLAGAYAHSDSSHLDQGSITVVTQVNAGDEVWVNVQEPADASLWGGWLTSFMGILLVPL